MWEATFAVYSGLTVPDPILGRRERMAGNDIPQAGCLGVHEPGGIVSLVREPDAGDLHVRFDERDVETEPWSNQ